MAWTVYILECGDKSLYTGVTLDVDRRIEEHLAGTGSRYVRSRVSARLVYREAFKNKSRAFRREAEIKSWRRPKKLALIAGQ